MRFSRAAAALVATLLALAPDAAQACSVCFSGPDATRGAFIATTIGLSALPLVLIGGVIWWLRRQFQRAEQEATERSADPAQPASI